MTLIKSSFIKHFKKKLSVPDLNNINEAIHYAFKLTDSYGINKLNKSIFEASIKYNIDEETLKDNIDNFFERTPND
tara:strand:- start:114 stop:341 length:228 start_codon:yes stop_codon:yes gene_type:complete